MSVEFVRSILEGNHGLFHLIHDFNHYAINYAHPSHFVNLVQGPVLAKIQASRAGSYMLSKRMLELVGVSRDFFYDFSEHRLRIALMDPATLNNLYLYAGTACCADQIAHVIDRDGLRYLKEHLGEELYGFALKRSQMLITEELKPRIRYMYGSVEAVFQNVYAAGQACFEFCLSGEPKSLINRFALKFDDTIRWNFNQAVSDNQRESAWHLLHRLLIKEVGKEWAQCFI
jgi:hypothetical protein